jgi:hypothetical protein
MRAIHDKPLVDFPHPRGYPVFHVIGMVVASEKAAYLHRFGVSRHLGSWRAGEITIEARDMSPEVGKTEAALKTDAPPQDSPTPVEKKVAQSLAAGSRGQSVGESRENESPP